MCMTSAKDGSTTEQTMIELTLSDRGNKETNMPYDTIRKLSKEVLLLLFENASANYYSGIREKKPLYFFKSQTKEVCVSAW